MTSHRDSVVEFASFSSRQSPRTEFAAMSSAPSVVLKGNVSADISIAHVRTSVAADHTLDPFSNTTCPTHPKAPLWRRSPRTVQTTQDPRTHEKQYISSKIQSELRKESALVEIDDFEFHAGLRKEISPRKAKIEQLCLLKDGVQRNEVDYDAIDPRTEARYERWKKEARIIQHASKGYYTHRENIQSSHHPQTSPSREDRNAKALGVRSKSCLSMETAVSRDGVSVESPVRIFSSSIVSCDYAIFFNSEIIHFQASKIEESTSSSNAVVEILNLI
eukprot:TRINITY_DN6135_c0_g1_i1.p1 TRINITY_DN6135_c0_g1~~TRINITY_DN6135_c0_g1_i1.p1  ORF type:complete len:276 (+),score=65.00 TRINITY_DN6135_c0_g1_i1:49-876(+)